MAIKSVRLLKREINFMEEKCSEIHKRTTKVYKKPKLEEHDEVPISIITPI